MGTLLVADVTVVEGHSALGLISFSSSFLFDEVSGFVAPSEHESLSYPYRFFAVNEFVVSTDPFFSFSFDYPSGAATSGSFQFGVSADENRVVEPARTFNLYASGFLIWNPLNGAEPVSTSFHVTVVDAPLVWFGTPGDDTKSGGGGDDSLSGANGNDRIDGLFGNDLINGNNGNDYLVGGDDLDTINGGNGNDTMIGGAGNDDITGGSGADVFGLASGDGSDTITDFKANTDFIGLSGGLTVSVESGSNNTLIKDGATILATLTGVTLTFNQIKFVTL